jgi:Integrase core domain
MFAIIHLLGTFIADLFKPPRRLEVENLFLRHQLNIALRGAPDRPQLRGSDRALLVWMTWLWPSLLGLSRVVQPDTILRWHRAGFRAYWRWKSTRHPTAEWLAQQIVEAFPWDETPTYLLRDNDGAYGRAFTNRVRTMGIRDRPISPRSPWQNAYVERLIGTLRRECLDHVLIYGERHLRRVLTLYSLYYNETRTHLGLGKDAPLGRHIERSGTIVTTPILSGLHHRYARI